jgi:hypothetical protein
MTSVRSELTVDQEIAVVHVPVTWEEVNRVQEKMAHLLKRPTLNQAQVERMHLVNYRGGVFWVRRRIMTEKRRDRYWWQVSWNRGSTRFIETRRRAGDAFKAVQSMIDAYFPSEKESRL